jgi:hypothetical protein
MLEKHIEKAGTDYARSLGWLVYKGNAPGVVGFHDRVHFKAGLCFTIEYKAPGKKATPPQRRRAEELSAAGIPCRCCDSVAKAKSFIDLMDYHAYFDINGALTALDLESFEP